MLHAIFPRHSRYTPYALEAVQTAKEVAAAEGSLIAETRHVLWSILAREETAAVRLLHRLGAPVEQIRDACGVLSVGTHEAQADEFADEMTAVGLEARGAAEGLGDECVGTAHLLIGLFTDPPIAELLRRFGVTRGRVGAELLNRGWSGNAAPERTGGEEMPGADPQPSALCPNVVNTAGWWAAFQVTISLITVLILGIPHPVVLLEAVIRSGLCLILIRPLLDGRLYAWSAMSALLFTQCAFWTASSFLLLAWAVWSSRGVNIIELFILIFFHFGFLLLLFDWALFSLTRVLFEARWWFGVGEREGWTMLMRKGGWVVALLGLLDAVGLVQIVGAGR